MLLLTSTVLPLLSILSPGGSAPRPVSSQEALALESAETGFAPHDAVFSYDYAQARYSIGDLDGLRLEGSYQLDAPWILVGHADLVGDEAGGVDLDYTSFSVGGGYVFPIETQGPPLDIVATAELEYGRVKASLGGFSVSDSEIGIRLRGGARYAPLPEVELFGGASIRTIFDSNFSLDGVLLYHFDNGLSVVGSLELGEDSAISVGVRYSF